MIKTLTRAAKRLFKAGGSTCRVATIAEDRVVLLRLQLDPADVRELLHGAPDSPANEAFASGIRKATRGLVDKHRDRFMVFNFSPFDMLLESVLGDSGTVASVCALDTETGFDSLKSLSAFCAMAHQFQQGGADNVVVIAFVEETPHHEIVDYGLLATCAFYTFIGKLNVALDSEESLKLIASATRMRGSTRHAVSHQHLMSRFRLIFTIPQFPNPQRLVLTKLSLSFHTPNHGINPSRLAVVLENNDRVVYESPHNVTWSTPMSKRATEFSLVVDDCPLLGDCVLAVYHFEAPDECGSPGVEDGRSTPPPSTGPMKRLLFRAIFCTLFVPSLRFKLHKKDMDLTPMPGWGEDDEGSGVTPAESGSEADDPHRGEQMIDPETGEVVRRSAARRSRSLRATNADFSAMLDFTFGNTSDDDTRELDALMSKARMSPAHQDLAEDNYSAMTAYSSPGRRGASLGAANASVDSRRYVRKRLTADPALAAVIRQFQHQRGIRALVPLDANSVSPQRSDVGPLPNTANDNGMEVMKSPLLPGRAGSVAKGGRAASMPSRHVDAAGDLGAATAVDVDADGMERVASPATLASSFGTAAAPPKCVAPPPPLAPPPAAAPPPKCVAPPPPLGAPAPKCVAPPPPIGAPPPKCVAPPPPNGAAPPPLAAPPPPIAGPAGKAGGPPPPPPPVRAGGGGPPPPPPPGSLFAKRAVPQGPKMKNFFWKKVGGERARKSGLWAQPTDEPEGAAVDADLLKSMFEMKPKDEKKDAAPVAKKVTSQAVSMQRQQNVGIALKKLKRSAADIRDALIRCDPDELDEETLDAIGKILPQDDEARKLKQEHGKGIPWGPTEEFMYEIAEHVPDAAERVQLWQSTFEMEYLLNTTERDVATLQAAVEALTAPGCKFTGVLKMILAIGNFMNQGTSHGNADGFSLENLGTLAFIKATDGKTTLLDVLVLQLRDRKADLLDWTDELRAPLKAAGNVPMAQVTQNVNQLNQMMNRMRRAIEKAKKDAAAAGSDGAASGDGLARLIKATYDKYTARVSMLCLTQQTLKEDVAGMLEFFGEDPAADEAAVMGYITTFGREFDTAAAAIEKRHKAGKATPPPAAGNNK